MNSPFFLLQFLANIKILWRFFRIFTRHYLFLGADYSLSVKKGGSRIKTASLYY